MQLSFKVKIALFILNTTKKKKEDKNLCHNDFLDRLFTPNEQAVSGVHLKVAYFVT